MNYSSINIFFLLFLALVNLNSEASSKTAKKKDLLSEFSQLSQLEKAIMFYAPKCNIRYSEMVKGSVENIRNHASKSTDAQKKNAAVLAKKMLAEARASLTKCEKKLKKTSLSKEQKIDLSETKTELAADVSALQEILEIVQKQQSKNTA